jgi:hypothetical protein
MIFSNVPLQQSAAGSSSDDTRQRAASASDEPVGGAPRIIAESNVTLIAPTYGVITNGAYEHSTTSSPETGAHYPSWSFSRLHFSRAQPPAAKYRLPFNMIAAAVLTSLRNRKRDLRSDAARLVASIPVPPVVTGVENLPVNRPFVILPNHYERPSGVWVGWGAIVISNAIARNRSGSFPIRWVMTSTWQDCYIGPKRIEPKYLHWILRRMSDLYGIILMPAADIDAFGRGAALRDLFRALSDPAGQVVAFHPEAGGFETMISPPKGIGRVLSVIDRQGIQMIPTGVFEDEGQFHVSFGAAVPSGTLLHLSDAEAANAVMTRIARLVPERTRGVFADEIAAVADATSE